MAKNKNKLYTKVIIHKNETEEQAIRRYRRYHAQDQNSLYKNPLVKLIFNMGHKFISKNGRNNRGVFLDIGCGIGYHLNFENLSEKKKFICLDIDLKMLKVIKDKRVIKIRANCEDIPLKDKSVDVVIASHILEHVSNLDRCLKEIKRILNKNGVLLVVLPCDPGFLWNFLTKFTPSRKRLKQVNLDYEMIMRYEHINTFKQCFDKLSKYFSIYTKKYYPFLIPNHNLNILCGIGLVHK